MSLHVQTCGHGPDLVLLHGWGMHGGVWRPVQDALARHFRLHLVDLPGFGLSPGAQPLDLQGLSRAVAAQAPAPARVCGWSMGGQVALQWALDYPQQVSRLILVSSTPKFIQTAEWQAGIALPTFHQFADGIQQDYQPAMTRFLSLQAQGGASTSAVIRDLRAHFFNRPAPSALALKAGLDILLQTDLRPRLADLQIPTLVLHGGRDRVVPAAAGHWLAANIARATLAIQESASHAPFLSHPDWFVQQITRYCHESD